MSHPELAPPTETLKKAGPDDTAYYMAELYHLEDCVELRLALVNPLEPMISTEEWLVSDQFHGDLLRKLRSIGSRLELHLGVIERFARATDAAR